MRTIEVAHLLPNLSFESTMIRVPDEAPFRATSTAFARGTMLATTEGLAAVEDLVPGTYIETSRGPQAILWIGSTELAPSYHQTALTRVTADAFGIARPATDLILGPAARIRHAPSEFEDIFGEKGVLSPVGDFVDRMGLIPLMPPEPVRLYHIAFRRHATFSASGIDVESYHPGIVLREELGPEERAEFLALFPYVMKLADFGPVALPRVAAA